MDEIAVVLLKAGRAALGLALLSALVAACGSEPIATPSAMLSPPPPRVDAPSARSYHSAVWTGTRMLVWGGRGAYDATLGTTRKNDGAAYDPETNTWTAISRLGAPSPRYLHLAVWAGSKMIVWGGRGDYDLVREADTTFFDGAAYDPRTDVWTSLGSVDAPDFVPSVGVSTGSTAILWGGYVLKQDGTLDWTSAGRIYDPLRETWRHTGQIGVPDPLSSPVAVWTGTRMIVWSPWNKRGGSYDPATDSWQAFVSRGAPSISRGPSVVWAGSRMILWGGNRDAEPFDFPTETDRGGAYDPESGTWTPTWTRGAPEPRQYHTAVSTGPKMIVWGGHAFPPFGSGGVSYATGAIYDPASDAWTATGIQGAPQARSSHTAVWTGSKMIVWGGSGVDNTGGVYDPVTDTWTPTATAAPPRQ